VKLGKNSFIRECYKSSVTIPLEQTFRELEKGERNSPSESDPGRSHLIFKKIILKSLIDCCLNLDHFVTKPKDTKKNFCGCGWPEHFLVPRGTTDGMPFQLFVMATNWKEDQVSTKATTTTGSKICRDAASYCGILDDKYPDKKPMGFPFDRPPDKDITTLKAFAEKSSNMMVTDVTIQFQNKIINDKKVSA
jgi:hypothetical protein